MIEAEESRKKLGGVGKVRRQDRHSERKETGGRRGKTVLPVALFERQVEKREGRPERTATKQGGGQRRSRARRRAEKKGTQVMGGMKRTKSTENSMKWKGKVGKGGQFFLRGEGDRIERISKSRGREGHRGKGSTTKSSAALMGF